jgi:hypothetical protein
MAGPSEQDIRSFCDFTGLNIITDRVLVTSALSVRRSLLYYLCSEILIDILLPVVPKQNDRSAYR